MTEISSIQLQRNLKTYLIFTVRPTVYTINSLFKIEEHFEKGVFFETMT